MRKLFNFVVFFCGSTDILDFIRFLPSKLYKFILYATYIYLQIVQIWIKDVGDQRGIKDLIAVVVPYGSYGLKVFF